MELILDYMVIVKAMTLIMEIIGLAWIIWIICMVMANLFDFGSIDFIDIFYQFLEDCSIMATQLFCISSIIVSGITITILLVRHI